MNKLVFFNENEYGYVSVRDDGNHIRIKHDELGLIGGAALTREEAIAAAKAILGHYGISYQVGEEVW